MSAPLGSLWCLLLVAAVLFRESAPLPERAAFFAAASLLVLAIMAETGRVTSQTQKTRLEWVADVAAVLAFLAFLGLYAFRLLT